MKSTLKLILLALVINSTAGAIILQPSKQDGPESLVIIYQGMGIDAKNYIKLGEELQTKSNGKLWVAIAEFYESLPTLNSSKHIIDDIFNKLERKGFVLSKDIPSFFIGHSLGGQVLQKYLINYSTTLTGNFYITLKRVKAIMRRNYN